MTNPKVSVVIVSQGRPKALCRCLIGLSQLKYNNFEVVVVADAPGRKAVQHSGFEAGVKLLSFEESNISAARNIGISNAAGRIVAFIDDDAVPEPSWLCHLVDPFRDSETHATGGYVRGRNGISYQSTASCVDEKCHEIRLVIDGHKPAKFQGGVGRAIKTVGTNCAFRKSTLIKLGGFDTSFRFYLDETDLNMRLGVAGFATAIVPLAQVHHGYLKSARRLNSRLPVTLFDVGASTAVYLRKYADQEHRNIRLNELVRARRLSLINYMVNGDCQPDDVNRILTTLHAGILNGLERDIGKQNEKFPAPAPFLPFSPERKKRETCVISGFMLNARKLHIQAVQAVKQGKTVSLYIFSRTARFHRLEFHEDGYWVQFGGLFGKSSRSEKLLSWYTMNERVRKEIKRVFLVRNTDEKETVTGGHSPDRN